MTSGEEALRMVYTWQPDLVLLEVMMPMMNGFETARRLQGLECTRDIPIIMLTGMSNAEDESLTSGAIDFLAKPFDMSSLRSRIRAHLDYNKRLKHSTEYVPERVIELPPMITQRHGRLFQAAYHASKRAFDFTLGLIMLIAFLPVFLAIATAIRLESRAPIVFLQLRTGYNGKRFKMYKFRTMVQNAEELKEKYRHPNTATEIPTSTPTDTPSSTPTDVPTSTPTDTPTSALTYTRSNTPTDTPTSTPSNAPTDTPTSTSTRTPSDTPSATSTPTDTNTPRATATASATPTPTNTAPATATPTASNTPNPAWTLTYTPTPTFTPSMTPTSAPDSVVPLLDCVTINGDVTITACFGYRNTTSLP